MFLAFAGKEDFNRPTQESAGERLAFPLKVWWGGVSKRGGLPKQPL
jgi:hypothetical protein